MYNLKRIFPTLFVLLFFSCNHSKVIFPIETSLGNLVKIEQKDMVETSGGRISPDSTEALYILCFEGKSEITFNVTVNTKDIQKAIPFILESARDYAPLIVDKETNIQYTPVFIGSKGDAGIISPNAWGINGDVKNYVWEGKLTINESGLVLVYLLPGSAARLVLKDGEKVFRLK